MIPSTYRYYYTKKLFVLKTQETPEIFILDFVRNIGAIHRGVGQSSGIPYRVKREDFIFSSISYHQNETISFL
jgi:hypothetical protein